MIFIKDICICLIINFTKPCDDSFFPLVLINISLVMILKSIIVSIWILYLRLIASLKINSLFSNHSLYPMKIQVLEL